LNDRLDSKNWRYRWRDDIAGKCFSTITNNHKSRGSRGRKLSVRPCFDNNWFLDALHSSFTNLTNWRNLARIKINSINTTELHNLSWTVVELSNDCNTTYPREIINLVLDMINFRLFLSKEADTKKNMNNFVKIYFQAKDIEEVRLSSIFRKHLKSIPSTFQSKEPPTVLYSRSSHIGYTIFNYKDVVDSVITDDWKEDNFYTCNCSKSAFCDPPYGHIVTGNMKVIEHSQLRKLMCYGPGFRESQKVRWPAFLKDLKSSLKSCVNKWAEREKVDNQVLLEWYNNVVQDVSKAVTRLSKNRKKTKKMTLSSPLISKFLEDSQEEFVSAPTGQS